MSWISHILVLHEGRLQALSKEIIALGVIFAQMQKLRKQKEIVNFDHQLKYGDILTFD